MIDTRNSYKAVKHKDDDHNYLRLYFRRWYSPFWDFFACVENDRERIEQRCENHARGSTVRHLGRFPRKPGESTPAHPDRAA